MSSPFNPNQQPMPRQRSVPNRAAVRRRLRPAARPADAWRWQLRSASGLGQQPQQGYYPQGQFQGAPYGGAPEKKKTGLIVGIIAAVLVVAIIAGIVIWALNKDDSDSVADSPTMPGVPSQGLRPAAGTNPMQPPVGTNPSQGTAPGNGSAGQGDMQQRVASMCKEEINKKFSNANISNENFTQPEVLPNGQKQIYTGIVSGTETSTNKSGRWEFTCNGYYIKDMNDYTGWITYKEA